MIIKCGLCKQEGLAYKTWCTCEFCMWGNKTRLMYHIKCVADTNQCIAVKPGNVECDWFDYSLDEMHKWTNDFGWYEKVNW